MVVGMEFRVIYLVFRDRIIEVKIVFEDLGKVWNVFLKCVYFDVF